MNPSTQRATRLYLTATLLMAFALRVYGLRWGLPSPHHLFSYHPDEFDIAGRAALMLARGDLNPHFFNYGSLTIYLTYLVGSIAFAMGFINDLAGWHLIGRLITVALGTATVYVVFLIGRTFYNEVTGLVAAAFLAVMPGHAVHSHYATVDVPATLFITLSLLGAAKILVSPSWRWSALAGVSAGWAGATKYNAVVILLSAFAAHVTSRSDRFWVLGSGDNAEEVQPVIYHPEPRTQNPEPRTHTLRSVISASFLTLFAAAGAFVVACPFAVLGFSRFQEDFLWEWQHVHRGHGYIFEGTGNGFWYHLTTNLPIVLSPPLLMLSLLGFFWSVWKHKPRDLVLMAFVVPYYFLIGSVQVRFLRYTLPLAPLLALYAAQWIEGWKWEGRQDSVQEPLRQAIRWFVLGYALLYTVAQVAVFARPDPRDAAAEWMKQHAPRGASVGLLTVPWFYTPPLTPYNGGTKTKPQFEAARSQWHYEFVITGWDVSALEQEQPRYFVLSEFEYREEQRVKLKEALRFLRALDKRYTLVKTFQNSPRLFGWRAGPSFPPHDWLYPFPEIRIYRRER